MKTIDTLKIAKGLKSNGFTQKQAESLSETFKQVEKSHLEQLVTKQDLNLCLHRAQSNCSSA